MAQFAPAKAPPSSPPNTATGLQSLLRRLFGRNNGSSRPGLTSSKQGSAKDGSSKDESPKDNIPNNNAPNDNTPNGNVPNGDTPNVNKPNDNTPKDCNAKNRTLNDKPPKDETHKGRLIGLVSRKVVPGIPRVQTFKRQQSELRANLEPVIPTAAERRAVSADRRLQQASRPGSQTFPSLPLSNAPDTTDQPPSTGPPHSPPPPPQPLPPVPSAPSQPTSPIAQEGGAPEAADQFPEPAPESAPEETAPSMDDDLGVPPYVPDAVPAADGMSTTTSQYGSLIHESLIHELEQRWILNLSMHFRDKSKREKFFVTYREHPHLWRRVTISLDYRYAPEHSLEWDLVHTEFPRDKNAKIYETIRESLIDIQFYDTVTNLKLQTTEGRLHVHVVEDVNETIHYPSTHTIQHMKCNRVREQDIEFDSHMSGFVYKVNVNGKVLIKKEIPGPDTVEEFLYEINALNRLKHASNVIRFYGVVVDDDQKHVKGLLISYAEKGALNDVIYDGDHNLPWPQREKWATQIIHGLSEIHEMGFVQGDFTLSNIVVDADDNAKIIDINRRGCPVGWEPPEAAPLIESGQRISMFIGLKSDLYQLGMVLWALATQNDEPETQGRPLPREHLACVPAWYRTIVDICLSPDPRGRLQALHLLSLIPKPETYDLLKLDTPYGQDALPPSISVVGGDGDGNDDNDISEDEHVVDSYRHTPAYPWIRPMNPPNDWSDVGWDPSNPHPSTGVSEDLSSYPPRGRSPRGRSPRGRSPPSPLPSNYSGLSQPRYRRRSFVGDGDTRSTTSAENGDPERPNDPQRSATPQTSRDLFAARVSASTEPEAVPTLSPPDENETTRFAVGNEPAGMQQKSDASHDTITAEPDARQHESRLSDAMRTPTQGPADPVGNHVSEFIGPARQTSPMSERDVAVALPPPLQQQQQQQPGHTEPARPVPNNHNNNNKELAPPRGGRPPVEGPPSPPPSREAHTESVKIGLDAQVLAELQDAGRAAVQREELAEQRRTDDNDGNHGKPLDGGGATLPAPPPHDNDPRPPPGQLPAVSLPLPLPQSPALMGGNLFLDELKGVGSAYDYASARRQLSIDDDDVGAVVDAETAARADTAFPPDTFTPHPNYDQ